MLVLQLSIASLLVLSFACGSETNKENKAVDKQITGDDPFPQELLTEFSGWTPVLNGDNSFASKGHGGILVKGYLNDKAATSAKTENPYPIAVGSVLAKAVVLDARDGADKATRVYFMRKMPAGFDPEHNDWAYAVANKQDGNLVFDKNIGLSEQLCVSCHAKFKQYDYVQTVEFYRKQAAE